MSCWGRANVLAVPFLHDDDHEDYELKPPPKKLTALQLTGITFFAVSGSAYGIEQAAIAEQAVSHCIRQQLIPAVLCIAPQTVPAGGPFLALLALLLAPIFWCAASFGLGCNDGHRKLAPLLQVGANALRGRGVQCGHSTIGRLHCVDQHGAIAHSPRMSCLPPLTRHEEPMLARRPLLHGSQWPSLAPRRLQLQRAAVLR